MTVQQSIDTREERFAVRGGRRNGIDRLFLIGELDRSSVLMLESELVALAHSGGAIVLDLSALTSIDLWGLRTLERAAQHADLRGWRLSIVNGDGSVLDAFERAGFDHLLSGADLSDLLDAGDGEWSPIPLPPLLGQRVSGPHQVARE
jgi:anti-anti-sigma factor